ncbi:MAG: LysM peptidoglycan-binding domain-containing protein [Thermoflexales bacterium]|nr:LysM peptidoglycan-binding domain-containing protein [Thermoflexales bacterium]
MKDSEAVPGVLVLILILVFASIAAVQGQAGAQFAQVSPLPTPPPPTATVVVLPTSLPTSLPTAQPTAGPTLPTATPLPPPPPTQILGYHTVRAGETLFCIGRAYAVSPWAIASQNGISAYPDYLRIGQVLAIPNVPWVDTYGPVCTRQFGGGAPQPTACWAMHTVYFGDTLYSLAQRYGTTVWAIAATNNIANPNLIYVGQTLCIP